MRLIAILLPLFRTFEQRQEAREQTQRELKAVQDSGLAMEGDGP